MKIPEYLKNRLEYQSYNNYCIWLILPDHIDIDIITKIAADLPTQDLKSYLNQQSKYQKFVQNERPITNE